MRLIRRYPMSTFLIAVYTWFGLGAGAAITASVTGGETTRTEATVVATAVIVSLAGIWVSVWLHYRHERHLSARFQAALDAPARRNGGAEAQR